MWNLNDKSSIYLQLSKKIKADIAKGDLKMGERIKSVRDLALDAGVNPNTMQRALSKLESEGILYSERTTGRFVTTDEKVIHKLKEDMLFNIYTEVENSLKSIGISFNEFINYINEKRGEE